MKINRHYLEIEKNYLFADIARRVREFQEANPDSSIIRMGIGDVTLPLAPVCVQAMQQAAGEMGRAETFRGYGPEAGYGFLREAICGYYACRGVKIDPDEVFVSDGAKSDTGNITDIFGEGNTILIPNPVYPVYKDTNMMSGRQITYMDANADNGFLPMPDYHKSADIIYICSPNNPTGAAYSRQQLEEWVSYACGQGAIILFDAAYEAFITDPDVPRSIFEIPDARYCAIEFCSLSKTAGFTGTRCGYTIVPKELEREGVQLGSMWLRRQTTKFNGVSYIVQRGAEAALSTEGIEQCRRNIAYYRENAAIIAGTMDKLGIWYTGGKNSPYIWLRCPGGMGSWEFFDMLLGRAQVVGTPGAGFGANGEGFFRLTAFGSRENTALAMDRFANMLQG